MSEPELREPELSRSRRESIIHGAMYGDKSYIPGVDYADNVSMLACLIKLHLEETLTEGQVARATRLDRVTIRHLADLFAELESQ